MTNIMQVYQGGKVQCKKILLKKLFSLEGESFKPFPDSCLSSLLHANLLHIVPISSDVSEGTPSKQIHLKPFFIR